MSEILLPPNRRCRRCGARDVQTHQYTIMGVRHRYCFVCWHELLDLIEKWERNSLRAAG